MDRLAEARRLYLEALNMLCDHKTYAGESLKAPAAEIYKNLYNRASMYILALEEYIIEHESGHSSIPRKIITCPLHNQTDCSPLLNGCNLPNRLAEAYLAGRKNRMEES